MVQLSPDTRNKTWDGCSGYHYSDSTILGFSHTHLSGTGCADLGDFLFRPFIGDDIPESLPFSHKDEKAHAGYYKVSFPSLGITAEMTALSHSGCHRYTFSGKGERKILIDMGHNLGFSRADGIFLEKVSENVVRGGRHVTGWANDRWVYFSALFSEPVKECVPDGHDRFLLTFPERFKFRTVRFTHCGNLFVDVEGAENNRLAEIPQADFEGALKASEALWDSSLGRVAVEGGSPDRRKVSWIVTIRRCCYGDHRIDSLILRADAI